MNYRKLMNGGIATVMLATAAFSTIAPAQAAPRCEIVVKCEIGSK